MSHKKKILKHLKMFKTITPLEALNLYGCFRLGARVYDLRLEGHNIVNENTGSNHAKYRLV